MYNAVCMFVSCVAAVSVALLGWIGAPRELLMFGTTTLSRGKGHQYEAMPWVADAMRIDTLVFITFFATFFVLLMVLIVDPARRKSSSAVRMAPFILLAGFAVAFVGSLCA